MQSCQKKISYSQTETLHSVYLSPSEKGKRKVQGVPQTQAAALPRNQEEEETDKTKQAQIEQTYIWSIFRS